MQLLQNDFYFLNLLITIVSVCHNENNENLNICLEREEINMLPVTSIKSNLIPAFGHASTSTKA